MYYTHEGYELYYGLHMYVGVTAHVCCSVLQCVAVCCSVLQCVAVCCSVLQCVAVLRITHVCRSYGTHVNEFHPTHITHVMKKHHATYEVRWHRTPQN